MEKIIISRITLFLILLSGCSTSSDNSTVMTGHNNDIHNERHQDSLTTEINLVTLQRQPFTSVIKTGGIIMVDAKDIEVIIAKSSGIVKFIDHFLFPGVKINQGQKLFTISGDQLAGDNTELNFKQIKSDLEEATANFERARMMISDKIITEEHFLSLKNKYEKSLNEFNNLNGTFSNDGSSISSPDPGYIKEVFITEGEKVVPGQPLASIVIEHNIVLKADISPDYLGFLPAVENANFKVGYSDKLYKTVEMGGEKISYGKSIGENSFYIPVYFRMNYTPELIQGTFAEVYLIGNKIEDAIVVPNSSLMEEYGKLYVFVKDYDGDFLKRYITAGFSDGEYTQVLKGLKENETIVASGAYQIKLAQLSTSAPAHNH